MKRELSIVIPIYNESETVDEFYARLVKVLKSQKSTDWNFSLIFVNDGSTDDTLVKLRGLQLVDRKNPFRIINLSRNFGHQQNSRLCYCQ